MNRLCRTFTSSAVVRSTKSTNAKWGDQTDKRAKDVVKDYDTIKNTMRGEAPDSVSPRFWPNMGKTTTYEPTDFSFKRASAPRNFGKERSSTDKFIELGINPLDHWKNPKLLANYVTTNGKILPGYENSLKGSTQRKLAKAIRRCRAAGLLSTVHKDVGSLETLVRDR